MFMSAFWSFFLTFLFICSNIVFAQKYVEVKGVAPAYTGMQLEIYQIQDYLSERDEKIASTTVKGDSTFALNFELDESKKLILKAGNNKGFIYASPGSSYEVFVPEKNKIDPYNPSGNFLEISFFELKSSDINYKILSFNRWVDEFVAKYYTKNNASTQYFVARLDTFKTTVETYYKADTLDQLFNYHRKFSIAKLDDLRFNGNRNQYEKYDFYIRHTPVDIQNEAYMSYINHFYAKSMNRFASDINNKVYLGLLKSSPTAMYNALGNEYTLQSNYKLRELVMIQILSELYREKDYPQTNILTVLDSVARFGLFPDTRLVAQNILFRLKELAPGSKAPDYFLIAKDTSFALPTDGKKYTYLLFIDPTSIETQKQLDVLKGIYGKYLNDIRFLAISKESMISQIELDKVAALYPWKFVRVNDNNSIFTNYTAKTLPYYVLIDPFGYIVQAPAVGPIPKGNNENIDNLFYQIQKARLKGNNGSDR